MLLSQEGSPFRRQNALPRSFRLWPRTGINTLAQGARLPTIYNYREFVEAGGLMSYGPNFPDLFRRAAGYVDKIAQGRYSSPPRL